VALATAGVAQAALPGRSGDIAVNHDEGDRGGGSLSEISIFTQGGAPVRQFARCEFDEGNPALPVLPCPAHPASSPLGARIAYDRDSSSSIPRRIAFRNTDGSPAPLAQLPPLTDSDSEPTYAPDGRLAFTGVKNGKKNVYIVNANGTGLRQLTFVGGRTPAWSSRNRIAYVRDGRLYSINPDGSVKKKLRRGDKPDYSPQGDRIVYQRTFNAGKPNAFTSLFILRSATRFRRLTRGRGLSPTWSPGGGSVAFERPVESAALSEPELASSLQTVRINRTGLRTVAPGSFDSTRVSYIDPTWLPAP